VKQLVEILDSLHARGKLLLLLLMTMGICRRCMTTVCDAVVFRKKSTACPCEDDL
jgi:hypothetical protein